MNNDELQRILEEARASGEQPNLREANLSWANLSGEDLSEANLSGANLRGVHGNNKEIKSLHIFEEYDIAYTFERLQIGCENHAIDEWWEFDDERILEMDGRKALKFWRKNKELIKQIIEHSPAIATGKES